MDRTTSSFLACLDYAIYASPIAYMYATCEFPTCRHRDDGCCDVQSAFPGEYHSQHTNRSPASGSTISNRLALSHLLRDLGGLSLEDCCKSRRLRPCKESLHACRRHERLIQQHAPLALRTARSPLKSSSAWQRHIVGNFNVPRHVYSL